MSGAGILARIEGRLGHLTLDRPKALNALTLDMVRGMDAALWCFERDDAVAVVLIDGAGERGLCAGGDIRAIYDACIAGDPAPILFWQEEYRLNIHIARFRKPIVAFMDGIVMGGGVGVSAHASHRVVTDTAVVAMPEVAIGFIPDVGGTYLMAGAPGELGTHAALTAARFGAADAVALGLADHHVPRAALPNLVAALRGCDGRDSVERALRAAAVDPGPSRLAADRGWIDAAYAAGTVEEIQARLAAQEGDGPRKALETQARMSPTSLKLTLRALREARRLDDLWACLAMELRLGVASLRRPDLAEGIRAMVVDKDMKPRWNPPTLGDVTDDLVASYFQTVGDHELGALPEGLA